MKNKKGVAQFIIPALLIIGAVAILSSTGLIDTAQLTGRGNYIERPVFKYVKCEAMGGLKYSTNYDISTSGQWLRKPSVTSSYNIVIKTPKPLGVISLGLVPLGGHRVEYSICNSKVLSESSCREYGTKILSGQRVQLDNIKQEEFVWVQYQKLSWLKWKEDSGAKYQLGFIPYGLREYDVLSGSANPINPNSCSIGGYSSKNDYIKSENIDKINSVSPKSNQDVFQPEEVRWYVSGYLTSASPSFALRYKNQDSWCRSTGTSAEIYKINEVSLGSGTYKIASADWSDYLGSETCCPKSTRGDEVCNNNFQWETIKGSECGAFQSCGSPNWVSYSEKQLIKYSCINGYCAQEIKDVECSSNYDCKDTNQICDANVWKCVDANVNLKGQVIETIPDNSVDCEARGGTWISKKTEDKSFWNVLGIGEPEVIVEEYCKFPSWNWTLIILIGVAIIFIFIFRNQILMGIRFVLGKVGINF